MRLSPDGRRLIYVAGLGQRPADPWIAVIDPDGSAHRLTPGHSPRWISTNRVVFGHQESGPLQSAALPGLAVEPFDLLSGNTVAAAGGLVAVGRTDPRRVLTSTGRIIPHAMDPAISDDGRWLAYVLADTDDQGAPRPGISTLFVELADGSQARRALWEGAPTRPRFGGTTLAWEIGRGLIAACADVSNPAVPATAFALPSAWKCSHPVPVWVPTRGELWILFVAASGEDTGWIYLASWTSLKLGEPRGYLLGASGKSAYDHDARPRDLDHVVVQWLDPLGRPEGVTKKLTEPRVVLSPPSVPEPEPEPEPLPDIPWTPDPTRTVDMLDFVKAAASAYVELADGHGELWLHKSQERPDWGENWDHDRDFIGFCEDRSTGTRMVTLLEPRPKSAPWTNTTRDRWSPEQIVKWNTDHPDRPVGDYRTLPLAGYTWRGNRVWMIRHVTGRAELTFTTRYDWWDLPELGGRWELHPPQTITAIVETGYARINGHEVFARTGYVKPFAKPGVPYSDSEWNSWGDHGWLAFQAYDRDGHEEMAARRFAPPEQRASARNAPFVPARFTPTYPIYDPAREPATEPDPMSKTHNLTDIDAVLNDDVPEDLFLGALVRYRNEVCLERDRVGPPEADTVTGGALLFFARGFNRERNKARFRGASQVDASVAGLLGAAADYRRAVGISDPQ